MVKITQAAYREVFTALLRKPYRTDRDLSQTPAVFSDLSHARDTTE